MVSEQQGCSLLQASILTAVPYWFDFSNVVLVLQFKNVRISDTVNLFVNGRLSRQTAAWPVLPFATSMPNNELKLYISKRLEK